MKIAFLINNAYGIGGTIRATANLSSAFATRHDVEVVSVHQVQDETAISFDGRVKITSLIDMREDSPTYEGAHPLTGQPCTMFPDTGAAANSARLPYSALQDERIGRWLRETDAHVVIATRPDLNGYLARDGQAHYLKIGQEHLSLDAHDPMLREHQNQAVLGLDAFVTVSEADAAQYRAELTDAPGRILCIPNAVPAPATEPSLHTSRVIVAAGRLVSVKRYDRLIDAFAKIAGAHPDWSLRIYGRGPEKAALRAQIDELGLYDRVLLMGPVSPIETEWAKGSIAAVSSDMESFGMTIVEAMHAGVPVVATDCPHGPAEIITHDTNGVLVPLASDVAGYADALDRLMTDAQLRMMLGAAARQRAAAFTPAAIARRYEALIGELWAGRYTAAAQTQARPHGRWRDRLRSTRSERPVTRPAAVSPQPAVMEEMPAPRPVAYARSTDQGGITVRFNAATLPAGSLDFLARLRRDPEKRTIRIPIPDVASAPDLQNLTITVDQDVLKLAEGRWDTYIARRGSNERIRLTCELAERARRVGQLPRVSDDLVVAWLPYTTSDGFLALRTWSRPAHAELIALHTDDTRTHVTAELLSPASPQLAAAVTVVAVSRQDPSNDIILPASRLPGHTRQFSFTISHGQALGLHTAEHSLWDLHLELPGDGALAPIGRIGGDIVERKKTDVVPAVLLPHLTDGMVRAKPFLTVTNSLALSLRTTDPSA